MAYSMGNFLSNWVCVIELKMPTLCTYYSILKQCIVFLSHWTLIWYLFGLFWREIVFLVIFWRLCTFAGTQKVSTSVPKVLLFNAPKSLVGMSYLSVTTRYWIEEILVLLKNVIALGCVCVVGGRPFGLLD